MNNNDDNVLPFAHMTDDELLRRVYAETMTLPALVLELAARLERAINDSSPGDDIETILRKSDGR